MPRIKIIHYLDDLLVIHGDEDKADDVKTRYL